MLAGRTAERHTLAALLDAARAGTGAQLVIGGEAGIGKTSLCRYAIASADGFTVLRASGAEMETGLPYATLHALVRPLLADISGLPPLQRAALESALSLSGGAPGDRFSVAAAVLSVLAGAAADRPLLVVVDDFQWVDQSSAEAVLFAARRLTEEAVALLLAVRGDPLPTAKAAQLPALSLGGLDEPAAHTVVEAAAGEVVDAGVATVLWEQTDGNPLALQEVAVSLTPDQRRGHVPLPDPVPAGDRLLELYRHRLEDINDDGRLALLVVAAAGQATMDDLSAAGSDSKHLEAPETAGLVEAFDGTVRFRHPLLRSAVYHSAPPALRRQVHRALATSAPDPDRAAWHLAEGTLGTNEAAATAVEEAATRSLARSGVAEAALALERAGHLTPPGDDRVRRLLDAARLFELTGRPERVHALVEETLPQAVHPDAQGDLLLLRGYVNLWDGDLRVACDELITEAASLAAAAPDRSVAMLVFASMTLIMDGAVRDGLATAQQAHTMAPTAAGDAEIIAAAGLAHALMLSGRDREAKPLVERCIPFLDATTASDPRWQVALIAVVHCLVAFEDYDAVRKLLEPVVQTARARGALALLPMPVKWLAEVDFRTGHWSRALAGATVALELSIDAHHNELPHTLVVVARMEAAQGRIDDCRLHLGQALGMAAGNPVGSILTFVHAARGLLALGVGDIAVAADELTAAASLADAHGMRNPLIIPFASDHVEALVRSGRHDDARTALAAFEEQARSSLGAWPHAAVARCRALLAGDDFEDHFARALEYHNNDGMPFARARTLLSLGERRRRTGSQRAAREPLHEALEVFTRLGADPWSERTRTELRATGERLAPSRPGADHRLTPQELRVAMAVAEGGTNKEVAAALFLSPKTVENHLGRIYAKLGVRSRTELARTIVAAS